MSHCAHPEECGGVYWPDHVYRELQASRQKLLAALEEIAVTLSMPFAWTIANAAIAEAKGT